MQDYIGLGGKNAVVRVYIDKRPNREDYLQLDRLRGVNQGEIYDIGQDFGNGWRKVFNLLAKLMFSLTSARVTSTKDCKTWQMFRDRQCLWGDTEHALLFSLPCQNEDGVNIIMGKTYGMNLVEKGMLPNDFVWLDAHFALSQSSRTIISPYFDYRQLTNERLQILVSLVDRQLHAR